MPKVNSVAPLGPSIVTLTRNGHGSGQFGISRPSHWSAFSLRYCSASFATCWQTSGLAEMTTKLGVRTSAPIEQQTVIRATNHASIFFILRKPPRRWGIDRLLQV